jgi:hypothetical protein
MPSLSFLNFALLDFSFLDFSFLDLLLLALAASLVGLSKTAMPGAGTIAVAIFAAVLPAKESTGALLVLLILGDLFAVWTYHVHADWPTLRRLVPTVLAGVLFGTFFLAAADDVTVRRVIGVILLGLVAVTLVRRATATKRLNRSGLGEARGTTATDLTEHTDLAQNTAPAGHTYLAGHTEHPTGRRGRQLATGSYGVLAGVTTMVANAGGPVMSMYFLATRYSMKRFLGTAAWFFLVVNLAKTPFSVSLGLISLSSLRLDLLLAPAVVIGALVGRRVARRINQKLFDRLVLALTTLSATYLLVS